MSPRHLLVLRHGQSLWNVEHRFQGQSDVGLSPEGARQAEVVARSVAEHVDGAPVAVVTSDLVRARATAAAVGERLGVVPAVDTRLREVHAGAWQGLVHAEIEARDGPTYLRWRAGEDVRLGGAERLSESGTRVAAAVRELLAQEGPRDGWLVVVGHGASLRAGVAQLLGLPALGARLGALGNACSAQLAVGDSTDLLSLVRWNTAPGQRSPAVSSLRSGAV